MDPLDVAKGVFQIQESPQPVLVDQEQGTGTVAVFALGYQIPHAPYIRSISRKVMEAEAPAQPLHEVCSPTMDAINRRAFAWYGAMRLRR